MRDSAQGTSGQVSRWMGDRPQKTNPGKSTKPFFLCILLFFIFYYLSYVVDSLPAAGNKNYFIEIPAAGSGCL